MGLDEEKYQIQKNLILLCDSFGFWWCQISAGRMGFEFRGILHSPDDGLRCSDCELYIHLTWHVWPLAAVFGLLPCGSRGHRAKPNGLHLYSVSSKCSLQDVKGETSGAEALSLMNGAVSIQEYTNLTTPGGNNNKGEGDLIREVDHKMLFLTTALKCVPCFDK